MDSCNWKELSGLFLFQLLTMEEIEETGSFLKQHSYKIGDNIFSEGDKGNAMYIVVSGTVKITKKINGREKELINLGPGDFFGEIALFDYVSRTANAVSSEESSVLEITRSSFNDFFSKRPQICAKILYQMVAELARRLKRSTSADGGIIF